jgi:hypothetical protein
MFDIKIFIIGLGIAFVSGTTLSWWLTADYKNAKFAETISTIRLDAAEAVRLATNKAREADAENFRIATELEVAHNEFRQNLDIVKDDNARLVSELGGLYDRYSAASHSNVPSSTTSPSSTPVAPTTGKLSKELTEFLLSESARADQAAAYAQTCYDWVSRVRGSRVLN